MDVSYLIVGIVLLSSYSNADSTNQNVTRTYNFSPIPVSTKLIARTKVPLFMNSRGSYTVTKILEETNTSLESLHTSTSATLVTFPTFSKPINYSSHLRTPRTKSYKASKSYKSPTIIIAATSTTTSKSAGSQASSTFAPGSTTKEASTTQKKNKLSMSKLALMAATLSADSTTKTTVTTNPSIQRKTTKPKPRRDKTKNPKNKLAKHQSTTPKTRKSKYNIKNKTIRKTKGGKNNRSKSNKAKKRKAKAAKNNTTNANNHTRKYRQANEDCHPYWNPKLCIQSSTTTDNPRRPAKTKIIMKRKVRRHTTTDFFSAAVNTMKNMYFKVFLA